VILPKSHQLRQNGGISILSSIGKTEKNRLGGDDNHNVFVVKNSLVKKGSVK
jgi:hypothetical protein